jgi:hypothetical protein
MDELVYDPDDVQIYESGDRSPHVHRAAHPRAEGTGRRGVALLDRRPGDQLVGGVGHVGIAGPEVHGRDAGDAKRAISPAPSFGFDASGPSTSTNSATRG